MKIIFKGNWKQCKISNLYVKQLWKEADIDNTNPKAHHHRGFEIHIIEKGHQVYEVEGKRHKADAGSLIVIPPYMVHKVVDRIKGTRKHSITFSVDEGSIFASVSQRRQFPIVIKTPDVIKENIRYIDEENDRQLTFSKGLMYNRITETVVHIMRICGFSEEVSEGNSPLEDARFTMAKQYIKDNIEFRPMVEDVALYCCISTKQLCRIFAMYDTTPSQYIKNQMITHAEKLLSDSELPLKDISDTMNFSSEYHFNSFFKKYAGVTPGEFRKMIKHSR